MKADLLNAGLAASPDAARRHAQEFPEHQPHVLAALEACPVDDLFDRHVGFEQKRFRAGSPAMLDFLKHRPACGLLESGLQCPAAATHMRRHISHLDRRVGMVDDELARPPRDPSRCPQNRPRPVRSAPIRRFLLARVPLGHRQGFEKRILIAHMQVFLEAFNRI